MSSSENLPTDGGNKKRKIEAEPEPEDSTATILKEMEKQIQALQKQVEKLTRENEAKADPVLSTKFKEKEMQMQIDAPEKQEEELIIKKLRKVHPAFVLRVGPVVKEIQLRGSQGFKQLLSELLIKYQGIFKQLEQAYFKRSKWAKGHMLEFVFYGGEDEDGDGVKGTVMQVTEDMRCQDLPQPSAESFQEDLPPAIAEYCQEQVKGDEEALSFWEEKLEEEKGNQEAPLGLPDHEALRLKEIDASYQKTLKKLKVKFLGRLSQIRVETWKYICHTFPKRSARYMLPGGQGTRGEESGEKGKNPQ